MKLIRLVKFFGLFRCGGNGIEVVSDCCMVLGMLLIIGV